MLLHHGSGCGGGARGGSGLIVVVDIVIFGHRHSIPNATLATAAVRGSGRG